jgi:hypothetical protein
MVSKADASISGEAADTDHATAVDPNASREVPAGYTVPRAPKITEDRCQVANLLRQIPGDFSLTRDGTTVNVRVRLNSAGPKP